MIEIWTDGACIGNGTEDAVGGWAFLLVRDGVVISEVSGTQIGTTNNGMEMTAALEGLAACEQTGTAPEVVSDSRYLVLGASAWMYGWRDRGWLRAGEPIPNAELWQRMYAEVRRTGASFRWVRGHDGEVHNERCDTLATRAARKARRRQSKARAVAELDRAAPPILSPRAR